MKTLTVEFLEHDIQAQNGAECNWYSISGEWSENEILENEEFAIYGDGTLVDNENLPVDYNDNYRDCIIAAIEEFELNK